MSSLNESSSYALHSVAFRPILGSNETLFDLISFWPVQINLRNSDRIDYILKPRKPCQKSRILNLFKQKFGQISEQLPQCVMAILFEIKSPKYTG